MIQHLIEIQNYGARYLGRLVKRTEKMATFEYEDYRQKTVQMTRKLSDAVMVVESDDPGSIVRDVDKIVNRYRSLEGDINRRLRELRQRRDEEVAAELKKYGGEG